MVALIFIITSSYGAGFLLLRFLRIERPGTLRHAVLALASGMGLWCLLLFAAGSAGLLYGWFFIALGMVPVAWSAALAMKERPFSWTRPDRAKLSLLEGICLGGTAIFVIVSFVSCFAPVTGGIRNDEICTHLSVPAEWLRAHGLAPLPLAISYMAGNGELLFMLAESASPGSGPRLVSWLAFLLCLAAIYCLGVRCAGRPAGILCACITAMNPLMFRGASYAFVDLLSSLFVIVPILVFFLYRGNQKVGYLVLAGLFMGVGCGIKTTNFPYAFITFLAAAAVLYREGMASLIKKCLLTAIVAAAAALPWPARNLALTGSPTFPPPPALVKQGLRKPLVADKPPYTMNDVQSLYDYIYSRYGGYRRSTANLALFPWQFTMNPSRFQAGDSIGSLLLSLLPIALVLALKLRKRRELWLMSIALGSAVLIYFLVLPEARYYCAAYMLLAPGFAQVLSGEGTPGLVRRASVAVLLLNLVFGVAVAGRVLGKNVLAALVPSRAEKMIGRERPFAEAFAYLSEKRPAAVVVMYPNQVFYYLHRQYSVDGDAIRHRERYRGACLLDIDYSQTLGREPGKLRHDYAVSPELPVLEKVFTGPDARVYRFK